ncbi:uncharacterized protein LOC124152024 isoform X1 [Haliotis rufescens]|uniref:uncharacterized protein LOC124152024 isoform X1 n=1 Tax=Haliotis rufescens TaxID=6454 RepID=UPI00201F2544|nr:uncharacterized protein LOC124152024 isoform X1 [Haliotis rufescens]
MIALPRNSAQTYDVITSFEVCMYTRDFFYNTDSDSCENCAELCHQASVRGTGTECRRLCPVNCPIDKYYDADARRCARCDELCHQATVRGTENKCRCLCPVDNAVTTTTTGTTQNVTRHVVAVSPKNNVTNAAGAGTTSICILGAIIILLCTTVLAVTVLWEIGTRRYYGDCCGFKASEVVEVESSNGRGKEETLRLNDRENEDSQIPN